jgi:hypothetical protein
MGAKCGALRAKMELPVKPWQRPSTALLDLHAMARRLRELGAVKNRQHADGLSKAIRATMA